VAFFMLLLFHFTTAVAEEVSNETCLACHGTEGFASPDGRLLFVSGDAYGASLHGVLPCTTCHADATAVPHEEKPAPVGLQACAVCHDEVVATYQQSVHGQARANGTAEAATCSSCHGSPHTIKKAADAASPVYPLNLPRTCGVCHGDPQLAERHGIPVVNAYQMYLDSIHGRALTKSGLLVAANCSSCHGFHDIRPKKDPESKVSRTHIPATCGTCHAGVEELYFKGVHGRALKEGRLKAPVCADCHTAHEITRVDTDPWKLRIVTECGTCHEESLKTYRDTLHGQVTNLGFTPVARCSDCHGSHRVLPASDGESSVSPANLVATCQKCHPQANANFARFSPHADPDNKERNPGLYYTARFMNFLIIGTFIFFGLHTILWLSRSLIERRKPDGSPPEES
jgi:DnaJ-class molecular chaperone